jgi:hypothetical protein
VMVILSSPPQTSNLASNSSISCVCVCLCVCVCVCVCLSGGQVCHTCVFVGVYGAVICACRVRISITSRRLCFNHLTNLATNVSESRYQFSIDTTECVRYMFDY